MTITLPNKAHLLPREVQAFLGISRSTLYRYLEAGIIPSVRMGDLYRIPRDEFMKSCQSKGNETKRRLKPTDLATNIDFKLLSQKDFFKKIMQQPRQIWNGEEFLLLKKPIVYMWYRGQEILYVGRGLIGITRMFSPHERLKDIKPNDAVVAWFFERQAEAIEAERSLIAHLKPKLNTVYKNDKVA